MKRFFLFSILFTIISIGHGHAQLKANNYEILTGKKFPSEIRKTTSYIESITIQRPKPNTSADGLAKINPNLPNLLKDYRKLIETAEVSSRFDDLYDLKISRIKGGSYATAHNFCDCETVLRLKHPESGRVALWLQADMDVVTDGSDPVRFPDVKEYDEARKSDWFLPRTSYTFTRRSTDPPNPFLEYYPNAVKELEDLKRIALEKQKNDAGVVWREVISTIDSQISRLKSRGMTSSAKQDLAARRNLVATKDPFVVLPIPWVNKNVTWGPMIGDYAAVIYKDKIYPCILGESGPSDKVGEASLRLAREVNPKASGQYRAASDVSVTYLFFPKSRDGFKAPDYTAWREKVASLLDEIGGISSPEALHKWE